MSEQTKDLVRRFYEAYNAGNVGALDAIVAPDFVSRQNSNPEPVALGLDALKRYIATAGKDVGNRFTIEDLVAEGDKVAVRYVMEGKNAPAPFDTPATVGKPYKVRGCAIYRVAGGKLAERWTNIDILGWLQQTGALPTA